MTRAAPQRLLEYLTLATEHLGAKGVEDARLDAELLLAHALGLTRVELYTNYDRPLSKDEVDRFRTLLRRRAQREPVAYIVGRREFWSLDFEVDRRVLIPRPETETLVEAALAALRARAARCGEGTGGGDVAGPHGSPNGSAGDASSSALRVLDLGTGSGAIAISLATAMADLQLVATDVSAAALEVAPRNAERHGVAARVEFRHGDLYDAVRPGETFDLIVSNPPYCRRSELGEMAPEVREWEPTAALVSGLDGMDVTARIVAGAAEFLRPGASLLLEVGTQAQAVHGLLSAGWDEVRLVADLAGRPRVACARLRQSETARGCAAAR